MNLSALTWTDASQFLQGAFTFMTAMVAFWSMGVNRNIKAVDVSLQCQSRHSDVMEKLYRLPYSGAENSGRQTRI